MIKFTALYPNKVGAFFDFSYYVSHHLELTKNLLGDALARVEIEKGISGSAGSPPPYVAVGHLYFDSLEIFRTAFLPYSDKFREDIPKFTDIEPLVQISEVLQ